jgi:hypothetical protein
MPSSKAAASEGPRRSGFHPPNPELSETALPRVGYVEDLNDARTLQGKRRVSAHQGWAGEKRGIFQHPAKIAKSRNDSLDRSHDRSPGYGEWLR